MATISRLVGSQVFQDLLERSLDKRLSGGYEVELLATRKSTEDTRAIKIWVHEVTDACEKDLLISPNGLFRRTALVVMTSVCVGMRDKLPFEELTSIFTRCFEVLDDEDAKTRYSACEAIYNIIKANTSRVSPLMPKLLEAISKVAGDVDSDNRQTATVLDRLVRESVLASGASDHVIRSVWSSVESSMLLPSSILKQLSLDWMVLLREEFSAQVYHERISHFFPPLLSLVSAFEGSSGSRKDLAFQAEEFLLRSLQTEPAITEETRARLVDVLIKYGKFQSTLNDKAKVILFKFIDNFGVNVTRSRQACDLLLVLLDSLLVAGDVDIVHRTIEQAHESFRNTKHFNGLIIEESVYFVPLLERILQKGVKTHNGNISELAVAWMHMLTPTDSFDGKLLIPSIVAIARHDQVGLESLSLLGKWCSVTDMVNPFIVVFSSLPEALVHSAVQAIMEPLDVHMRTMFISAFGASLVVAETKCLFPFICAIPHITDNSELREYLKKNDDAFYGMCEPWKGASPIGFVLLATFVGRFNDAVSVVTTLPNYPPVDALEAVVDLVESDVMVSERLALLSADGDQPLVRTLREIGMRLSEQSKRYNTVIKRLQLVP